MDELVKMLRTCAERDSCIGWREACPYLGTGVCDNKAEKAADAIEELSRDLDSMNEANIALYGALLKWIPVEERLPDDGHWVLVWGHGQHIPTMMFRQSGAWIDDQFEFYTTVTHWMPLPEPPREES